MQRREDLLDTLIHTTWIDKESDLVQNTSSKILMKVDKGDLEEQCIFSNFTRSRGRSVVPVACFNGNNQDCSSPENNETARSAN